MGLVRVNYRFGGPIIAKYWPQKPHLIGVAGVALAAFFVWVTLAHIADRSFCASDA